MVQFTLTETDKTEKKERMKIGLPQMQLEIRNPPQKTAAVCLELISRNFFTVWKIIDFPISQIIFATTLEKIVIFLQEIQFYVIKMTTKSFFVIFS